MPAARRPDCRIPGTGERVAVEAYGHKFTKTPSGAKVHGVVTHVIDKQGLRRATINLVLYLNGLVNEVQRPAGAETRTFWDRLRGFF